MGEVINIYCDESRHTNDDQKFMIMGGLWLPRSQKPVIDEKLKAIKKKHSILSEIKWTKVSTSRLPFYFEWVDAFIESGMEYRCIVIDKGLLDYSAYHEGDRELAFYKFYYEMLHQKMDSDNKYYLFLDFIKNTRRKRLHDLKNVLNNKLGSGIREICSIQALDSKSNVLIQMTDILTGAVGYAWNNFDGSPAKLRLCEYLAGRLYKGNLIYESMKYGDKKFNIFKIRL